ncbi:hypothetical protein HK102_001206 [Quaeritorhiza haematococci]|nr:hypothetical protein HK102_001206 [Quaeritorhiza haematococci]
MTDLGESATQLLARLAVLKQQGLQWFDKIENRIANPVPQSEIVADLAKLEAELDALTALAKSSKLSGLPVTTTIAATGGGTAASTPNEVSAAPLSSGGGDQAAQLMEQMKAIVAEEGRQSQLRAKLVEHATEILKT